MDSKNKKQPDWENHLNKINDKIDEINKEIKKINDKELEILKQDYDLSKNISLACLSVLIVILIFSINNPPYFSTWSFFSIAGYFFAVLYIINIIHWAKKHKQIKTHLKKQIFTENMKNEHINSMILKVWNDYHPILYPEFRKGEILFIGLNPSFSNKAFKKILKGTENQGINIKEKLKTKERKNDKRRLN